MSLTSILLLTTATALVATSAAAAQDSDATDEDSIDDVVYVTATKRSEDIRDVPASVSAITGEALQETGAESFADYIERIPGAIFNEYQPGNSHVVLRGIATTAGNAQGQGTVGYYINDVPLTEPGWSIVIPDIDAFDVDRVEVLRGPQGSLYGAASLGGLVNYIANTADPSGFDAALEQTVSSTENADMSFSTKAMVNVPLSDTFAARGVYTYRQQAGYLDNIGTGKDGANDVEIEGGRLSLVWTPNDLTRLEYLGLIQTTGADDSAYRNPDLGDLVRDTALPETVDSEVEIHSLRLERDLGFADFVAIAAHQEKSQDWIFDFTPYLSAYNADLDLDLEGPLFIASGGKSEGDSLEVRFSSKSGGVFEWLVGAMYAKTDKNLYEKLGAAGAAAAFDNSSLYGPGSGAAIAPDDTFFNAFYGAVDGTEQAVFGEVSWNFAPAWTVTGGGRLFSTKIDDTSTQVGFSSYPGDPIVDPATTEEEGFSPKVSLEYEPSDDLMIYGLVSTGFRFGQPNASLPSLEDFETPSGSESDSLVNYEIGVRSSPLENLTLDVTYFHVDWSDIQLRLQRPDNFNYAGNGGSAKSEGVEVSANWMPTDRLSLSSNVTYMDAELTEDVFILYYGTAQEGTPLAGSSDWSVSNFASYELKPDSNTVVSLSHRYLSEGISDISSAAAGAPNLQGDYNVFDARLSTDIGPVRASLFADNITDERGVTRTVPEATGLGQGLIRPRTIGVTARWDY